MSIIIKSDSPSGSVTPLYRDALVNSGTRWLIDTKNTHCFPTPSITPVATDTLVDLSPSPKSVTFTNAGYEDSSAQDGVEFTEGASSHLAIGAAGDVDLGAENVTSFCVILWLARETGHDTSILREVAGKATVDMNSAQWGCDTGLSSGRSLRWLVGTSGGNVGTNASAVSIVVDTVQQHAIWFEDNGVDSTVKRYTDGKLKETVVGTGKTGLVSKPSEILKIGGLKNSAKAGFRFYRGICEVSKVSSGVAAVSGADLEKRIKLDYELNKNRFTF